MQLQCVRCWFASSAAFTVWPRGQRAATALTCKQEASASMWRLFTSSGSLALDQETSRDSFSFRLRPFFFFFFPFSLFPVIMINGFLRHSFSRNLNTSFLKDLFSSPLSPGKTTKVRFHFVLKGRTCKGQQCAFVQKESFIREAYKEVNFSTNCISCLQWHAWPSMTASAFAAALLLFHHAEKDSEVRVSYRCSAAAFVWKPFLFLPSLYSSFLLCLYSNLHAIEWINVSRQAFFFCQGRTWREEGIGGRGEGGRSRLSRQRKAGGGGGLAFSLFHSGWLPACVSSCAVTFNPGAGGLQWQRQL